jgi:hypothetical protein
MKRLLILAVIPLLMVARSGYAAEQTAEEILKAIVKVRAVIHDDAVTAQSLGTGEQSVEHHADEARIIV